MATTSTLPVDASVCCPPPTDDPLHVPPGGETSVAPRTLTPDAIFARTRSSSGNPSDRPFHIVIAN
ncbi:hypothetical protein [Micromonospora kangleipakensis]|uniref:hypothetical protein n=1 Tax=Micromonospora kangleipakensis TaxID=1077942 RepID=UPI001F5F37F3|nr:hypothetical protein [Micromonospora kangleipakensis]